MTLPVLECVRYWLKDFPAKNKSSPDRLTLPAKMNVDGWGLDESGRGEVDRNTERLNRSHLSLAGPIPTIEPN